jgi:hypothetical protein
MKIHELSEVSLKNFNKKNIHHKYLTTIKRLCNPICVFVNIIKE